MPGTRSEVGVGYAGRFVAFEPRIRKNWLQQSLNGSWTGYRTGRREERAGKLQIGEEIAAVRCRHGVSGIRMLFHSPLWQTFSAAHDKKTWFFI